MITPCLRFDSRWALGLMTAEAVSVSLRRSPGLGAAPWN